MSKIAYSFILLGIVFFLPILGQANMSVEEKLTEHYQSVNELPGFPYLREYLKAQHLLSRQEIVQLAKKDNANWHQDAANYKPLFAEIAENHLSHLLQWMTCSVCSKVQGMAVYDNHGMLQGFSGSQCSHSGTLAYKDLIIFFPVALNDTVYQKIQEASQKKPSYQNFSFVLSNLSKTHPSLTLAGELIYDAQHQQVGTMLFLMAIKSE